MNHKRFPGYGLLFPSLLNCKNPSERPSCEFMDFWGKLSITNDSPIETLVLDTITVPLSQPIHRNVVQMTLPTSWLIVFEAGRQKYAYWYRCFWNVSRLSSHKQAYHRSVETQLLYDVLIAVWVWKHHCICCDLLLGTLRTFARVVNVYFRYSVINHSANNSYSIIYHI